jgi:hypothetical protein
VEPPDLAGSSGAGLPISWEERPVTHADDRRRLAVRAVAVLGIVPGLALLAGFIPDLPAGLNTARILLFLCGGVAVVLAAYGPHSAASSRLALTGAVPIILANGTLATWVLLSIGRERPGAGEFGLVGFYAGLGLWLAHAWYGIIAIWIDVMWRWPAFVLVVGSLLAITGMDRLELTSPAHPTIFGPLSLLGIALNGIAWVLVGVEIVTRGMRRDRPATTAPDAADA